MLTLRQITLVRGNKTLLTQASANLYEKQKIGLVGDNGCGKSSLFGLLLGEHQVEVGECLLNAHLRISHLSQQLPDSEEQAIDFVLQGDTDYQHLLQHLSTAQAKKDDAQVLACHEELNQTGGYGKPAKAASILAGLGFTSLQQNASVNSFSGGWRMRLNLARCLMKPADLILLDEPTNHLDMEAIFWLEKWLKQCSCSVILISHDRDFLDAFVTHILHIEHQDMNVYKGNYSAFEQLRAQKLALQSTQYEKQQKKISHMQAYVARFRAQASKAAQAQSRLNAIAKMDVVAQAQVNSPFTFEFYPCPRAGKPLINCDNVSVGYGSDAPVLKKLNLIVNPGDRIALLGPNGEGKSTLIKTLTGVLSPLTGTIMRSTHLKIGYFAQHQLEQLDCNLSPIQTIQVMTPDTKEQTIRDFLGGFDFIGDMASNKINHFSGGEKARLALAKLVWLKPNLLLLDEPTNHLDLGMRAAIEMALQRYEGALILISHDRHMLRTTVNDFYLVYHKKVEPFNGDLDQYHQWLQNKDNQKEAKSNEANNDYREKRVIQNRLKKIEQSLECYQNDIKGVELLLADPSLYTKSINDKLNVLTLQRSDLKQKLKCLEEEWLMLMAELEE